MLNKTQLQEKFPQFMEGMKVYSQDGENLGKVIEARDDHFIIQKGFFFPKDFSSRYEDIADVRDGDLYLSYPQSEFSEWRDESYAGWSDVDRINQGQAQATPRPEYQDRYKDRFGEQVSIPVAEEELEARKTVREAGQVRVNKVVHTEFKHFTVPVMREEVRVERVPVSGGERHAQASGEAFKDETVSIPVREEEVEITKRPVVKEEIRVSKEQIQEQRDVSGEVRREEVTVEEEGTAKRKGKVA